MIVKQILLASTLGNVLRTVWRICILMLGLRIKMPYLKQLFPFFLFFFFLSSSMDELYPLFFENLSDSIPSVRQGAAVSLSNVVKAYGRYLHLSLVLTNGFLWIM